jgi:hypothetical protein
MVLYGWGVAEMAIPMIFAIVPCRLHEFPFRIEFLALKRSVLCLEFGFSRGVHMSDACPFPHTTNDRWKIPHVSHTTHMVELDWLDRYNIANLKGNTSQGIKACK